MQEDEKPTLEKRKMKHAPTLLSFVSLFGFLLFVPPNEENFLLSLVPLVLLWLVLYFCVGTMLEYLHKKGGALRRILRIATASVGVLIVMFSALGQLSMLDIVALVSLVSLGSFYFDRTWRR